MWEKNLSRANEGERRPGVRFSKVPKLFGLISGDIIYFVSSNRRRLETRNLEVILIFILLATYERAAFENKLVGVLGLGLGF